MVTKLMQACIVQSQKGGNVQVSDEGVEGVDGVKGAEGVEGVEGVEPEPDPKLTVDPICRLAQLMPGFAEVS